MTLLLRHYELTNENVSYFLTNQSKAKTFIDLKVTRKPKPTKNSTRPYLNEIPAHFTYETKTKGYGVIGVNLFLRKLMRSLPKKRPNQCTLYYSSTTINYGKFTTGHYRRAAPGRWASVPPFSKTNTTMAAFVKLEYAGFCRRVQEKP